ncbi:heterokaryon incompatibility protein-domain-containing protein [Truncatella angustata]|uniref:Heterokaryon incompatibility protein-domain-containing protein n=1 Tax=Truncatella angustata TaxID=152316 RepID=A0A9P8ZVI2_9PEZI|nr:heterokaryon incompatibility protein-domain-containing protein [Truncatella angustata]KAH6652635.1 heterokaryon incompatibility protein-domain-containing protein [Truncatella angustata]
MRLLHFRNGELNLTSDYIHDLPPYAILSHTWGIDGDEVTFQDLVNNTGGDKPGYRKILFCGEQAKCDGLEYFWVDTCCIDGGSSVELTEAINSMFRWYQNAAYCYVYLSDVSTGSDQALDSWETQFWQSRWFTRIWTLQDLIAPQTVRFFSVEGYLLGDKQSLEQLIHDITGLPTRILRGCQLSEFSIAERCSWAKNRRASRPEDKAYCLLGILGISMVLQYGEGEEGAFRTLRREIMFHYNVDLGKC